jgi:hypothetical protein
MAGWVSDLYCTKIIPNIMDSNFTKKAVLFFLFGLALQPCQPNSSKK